MISCATLSAQVSDTVRWISFEVLDDSLSINPKKVFVAFYTDWCRYCKKMEKKVFTRSEVIDVLNKDYYAVRFDAEFENSMSFGGKLLVNDQLGESRRPLHQITQLLALKDGKFVAPTILLLDENFHVTSRYFEYLDSKTLLEILR